jgi:hypothetical protein
MLPTNSSELHFLLARRTPRYGAANRDDADAALDWRNPQISPARNFRQILLDAPQTPTMTGLPYSHLIWPSFRPLRSRCTTRTPLKLNATIHVCHFGLELSIYFCFLSKHLVNWQSDSRKTGGLLDEMKTPGFSMRHKLSKSHLTAQLYFCFCAHDSFTSVLISNSSKFLPSFSSQ